ncbi:hypothetical protein QBC33DRAFT_512519 [Phialemonium atrogriseum]|uniref:Uncharacterized protein n=1 Tax=Phialemonium atrogriseum TaxID=1093897 RepID=A0AAJ0C484_9PEZI|nr:uncharacterized protein QBC33DRAFT_512519 [Phialemonium atrogriseum]KAK1769838.1 hypothetical protein QBC33DRAFT_512519 [Phialemonium atrogriseum]
MENEPPAIFTQDDGRSTKRGRIMGKLFGRDRKASNEEASGRNVNDFLRGPADKAPASQRLPVLTKLDTSTVTRYPNALSVIDTTLQGLSLRQRSHSPRTRNKKGLVVRFVDTFPEVIGEGGDVCEIPTLDISKRRRLRPPAVTAVTAPPRPSVVADNPARAFPEAQKADEFAPLPPRRTQTDYSTISDAPEPEVPAGRNISTKYLDSPVVSQDEKRKSFIEIHQAQMREAEGLAFANAVRSATSSSSQTREGIRQSPLDQGVESSQTPPAWSADPSPVSKPAHRPGTPENRTLRPTFEESPSSLYSSSASPAQRFASLRQDSRFSEKEKDPESATGMPSLNLHDVVVAAADEAMITFVARTRHLFELFRLHSETVRPLLSSAPEDLARAGLWWFLRGRMALEAAIRERPTSPQDQQQNEFAKQQAYADLAKGYWLAEEIIPEVLASNPSSADAGEVDDVRRTLVSNLRKLAVSMKRNGFLPPEEAFLPQTIDKSVWVEYPSLSRDLVALLWGTSSTALSQMQKPSSGMAMLDALPLGDSSYSFCFGRVHADVFLVEQGVESQQLYLPCLLSITRPQKQSNLVFVIASQNGAVQLRIQGNKNAGPVWEDVRWRSESCSLNIKLPRGFILVAQCSQTDYRMLWSMYEFNAKIQTTLYPKQDEQCVFRSTVRAFQYFDNDPQVRQFPRESVPSCEVALFERILQEGAATGPRCFHRGYRIAVVTGTRIKTISGVNQVYLPQVPVQFGFLRGEQNDPALSLKFENGRQRGNMVISFNDEKERLRMHSLLIGTALHHDEHVYCEVSLKGVRFSERLGDSPGLKAISDLPWERARVINEDTGGDRPSCVLADKLRVVFEFQEGTITDRVNIATGEFKMRLDVQNPTQLVVYRQPQSDLTVAVTEAKVSRELPQGLARALELLQQTPTLRTYVFPTMAELHRFQTAVTGFNVLFDGIASAFAISRRRMVVPIHKKWEAGATRIQVIQQDGVTQLLAFFEDFAHGKCMSFMLKGTDVFEAFGKTGKAGVKFDDAKFPLPKMLGDADDAQAVADAAFVCLDMPELPGEHDDISITFESEADRDNLIKCLPAPVKTSRLSKK